MEYRSKGETAGSVDFPTEPRYPTESPRSMAPHDPLIVWPAPGSPALLKPGNSAFTVIVAHPGLTSEDLAAWLRHLVLVGTHHRETAPLELVSLDPNRCQDIDSRIQGFAELPDSAHLGFVRCTLRSPHPLRPSRPATSTLFDLCHGETILRPRSVAVMRLPTNRLSLAFACDIHYGLIWQKVLGAVHAYTPDLAARVLDPLSLWHHFVEDANGLWRRGELDLVVLGGDVVDHVHIHPDEAGSSTAETNVHHFLKALMPLRPPVLIIPGNHDFRLLPWRPGVYGLHSIGLTRAETARMVRTSGMWNGSPLESSDIRALKTCDADGGTALAHHLRLLSPATDFSTTAGDVRLVFASSGGDAIAKWRSATMSGLASLLRSLPTIWHFPDSEGLYEEQVQRIKGSLETASGAAVFLHAPLIHRASGGPVDMELPAPSEDSHGRSRYKTAMEARWQRSGLRAGVCLNNACRLLEILAEKSGPVVTFSGHVHKSTCIELNRQRRRLRSTDFSSAMETGPDALLITGPGLTQQSHHDPEDPGYLRAEFECGRLRRIEQRSLLLR